MQHRKLPSRLPHTPHCPYMAQSETSLLCVCASLPPRTPPLSSSVLSQPPFAFISRPCLPKFSNSIYSQWRRHTSCLMIARGSPSVLHVSLSWGLLNTHTRSVLSQCRTCLSNQWLDLLRQIDCCPYIGSSKGKEVENCSDEAGRRGCRGGCLVTWNLMHLMIRDTYKTNTHTIKNEIWCMCLEGNACGVFAAGWFLLHWQLAFWGSRADCAIRNQALYKKGLEDKGSLY